ncbi:MAG: hypothetical protein LWY06_07040 [Firmicutes bacterium]|nr:hypothetical protein [Bacillota bacterium]
MNITSAKMAGSYPASTIKPNIEKTDAVAAQNSSLNTISKTPEKISANQTATESKNSIVSFDINWKSMSDITEIRAKMKESISMKYAGTLSQMDNSGIRTIATFYKPEPVTQAEIEINKITTIRTGNIHS